MKGKEGRKGREGGREEKERKAERPINHTVLLSVTEWYNNE